MDNLPFFFKLYDQNFSGQHNTNLSNAIRWHSIVQHHKMLSEIKSKPGFISLVAENCIPGWAKMDRNCFDEHQNSDWFRFGLEKPRQTQKSSAMSIHLMKWSIDVDNFSGKQSKFSIIKSTLFQTQPVFEKH